MRDLKTIKQEIKDTQKVEEIKKMFDKEGIDLEILFYLLRDLKIHKDDIELTNKINDIINKINFDEDK